MGKERLELSRVAARDPKSRLSANSSTSPWELYAKELACARKFMGTGIVINKIIIFHG